MNLFKKKRSAIKPVLFQLNNKLYKDGIFNSMSFVNYAKNKAFYKEYEIINL